VAAPDLRIITAIEKSAPRPGAEYFSRRDFSSRCCFVPVGWRGKKESTEAKSSFRVVSELRLTQEGMREPNPAAGVLLKDVFQRGA
jgi:hypothetical protein